MKSSNLHKRKEVAFMNLYCGRILIVDLTNKTISQRDLNVDWAEKYIGGKGLGFRYLFSEISPNVDPLSPENVMMLFTGPLAGTLVPTASKMVLITKSPATGTILDSYVGGGIGAELKFAGFDAVIIRGKSKEPVYLVIDDESCELHDADELWGRGIFETDRKIKDNLKDGKFKTLSIGPAGEKLIRFSCIGSESYRHLGRGGCGAVMGSKNLKAIAVKGTKGVKVHNLGKLLEVIKNNAFPDLFSEENSWVHSDGTPLLIDVTSEMGILPTNNFQKSVFEEAAKINSDSVKKVKQSNRACFACPLGCGNFTKTQRARVEGPEYETLSVAGSNCGIGELEAIIEFNEICDDLGLDTISTGNVIAFAMEMTERGVYDFGVRFGDKKNYLTIPGEIAYLNRDRGKELSLGVRQLSNNFGGREFAMEITGLEFPGYEPRGNFGMGLGYATSERGACHLRAWTVFSEHPFDPEEVPKEVISFQHLNSIKWSMIFCDFWGSIGSDLMAEIFSTAFGKDFTSEYMDKVGERIWNLGRVFNVKAGFSRKDDYVPIRTSSEALPEGPTKGRRLPKEVFESMLSDYYRIQGWDSNGIPTKERLNELGIIEAELER
jgi:aldehyde:ferredoxin oxidoreductase